MEDPKRDESDAAVEDVEDLDLDLNSEDAEVVQGGFGGPVGPVGPHG
jgi:hypothetical protein